MENSPERKKKAPFFERPLHPVLKSQYLPQITDSDRVNASKLIFGLNIKHTEELVNYLSQQFAWSRSVAVFMNGIESSKKYTADKTFQKCFRNEMICTEILGVFHEQ